MKLLDRLEYAMIDIAAKLAPWLADLPVAYLSYRAGVHVLGWPVWISLCAGIAVESLGIATAATALELRDYNALKRTTDPSAPVTLAYGMIGVYFVASSVMTTLNVDWGNPVTWTLMVWPLLSIAGTLNHALVYDHARRVQAVAASKAERKAARKSAQPVAEIAQPVAPGVAELSTRDAILAQYAVNPDATQATVAQQIGVSRQSVSTWLRKLADEGVIERNGSVKVVSPTP